MTGLGAFGAVEVLRRKTGGGDGSVARCQHGGGPPVKGDVTLYILLNTTSVYYGVCPLKIGMEFVKRVRQGPT